MSTSDLFTLHSPPDTPAPKHSTQFFASSLDFLAQFHRKKSEDLKALLAAQGWPYANEYGEHAEATAFIIALHSDYDLDFQILCHGYLMKGLEQGRGNTAFLAFLTDRILCNKGLHQRFGTQFREAPNGSFVPKCLEDSDAVDALREQVGLGETLSDYMQRTNDGDVVSYRVILHGYVEELEEQKQNKVIDFPRKN